MKILITIVLSCFSISLMAQNSISHTKWKGHIEQPQPLDIVLEFKNDSLIATSAEGMELEVMYFAQTKDTLTLRKLNGQSPCDFATEGLYRMAWTDSDNTLVLHIIKDDCIERRKSITSGVGYFRVKD